MEPATEEPSLLFTPLMISMVGIVSTALAILMYHIILNRCCLRVDQPRRALSRRLRWSSAEKANGLDQKVLESIPIVAYSKEGGVFGVEEMECAVCLSELEEKEMVRLLPTCQHAFHVSCIDEWFSSHTTCPVCRSPIVAPVSLVSIDTETCHGDEGGSSSDVVDGSITGVSGVLPAEESKPAASPVVLKRSFSMDCSFVSIKIQRDGERDVSSPSSSLSSSSSKEGLPRSSSNKLRSLRSLERASSVLIKSYSRLWSNNSRTSEGALPR